MTKKDYILIADAIYDGYHYYAVDDNMKPVVNSIVESVADALATTNPRFDRERFVNRCFGVK
jgi:hypothetical protein